MSSSWTPLGPEGPTDPSGRQPHLPATGPPWSRGHHHPQRLSFDCHCHQVNAVRPRVLPVSTTQLHETALGSPASPRWPQAPGCDVAGSRPKTRGTCILVFFSQDTLLSGSSSGDKPSPRPHRGLWLCSPPRLSHGTEARGASGRWWGHTHGSEHRLQSQHRPAPGPLLLPPGFCTCLSLHFPLVTRPACSLCRKDPGAPQQESLPE